ILHHLREMGTGPVINPRFAEGVNLLALAQELAQQARSPVEETRHTDDGPADESTGDSPEEQREALTGNPCVVHWPCRGCEDPEDYCRSPTPATPWPVDHRTPDHPHRLGPRLGQVPAGPARRPRGIQPPVVG